MAMPSFMSKYMKDNKAVLAEEELNSGVVKDWIDSGCYIFNALLSADIYKGFASNKITCIAGAKATGKSWYCLQAVKAFLNKHEDGIVVYYDSESTLSKQMLDDRGIPSDRVVIDEVITIDEWGTKVKQLLDGYAEEDEKTRVPLMIVLDSLGQLTTEAEAENVAKGKNTRDLQKQNLIKKALRVCTVQSGKLNVPIFVTAHTYKDIMSFIPQDVVAGGEALQYAASSIIMLTKAKDRQGSELVGNIITCNAYKSRFTKEGTKVKTRLRFDTGLDRYYGMIDLAEAAGIWKKVGTRYDVGGKMTYGKTIEENPTEYFTPEVLDKINEYVKQAFSYGSSMSNVFDSETMTEEDVGEPSDDVLDIE
ncbi:AAA family ATPase [bacterium]|nr:AAA family ATPase [bacterium]